MNTINKTTHEYIILSIDAWKDVEGRWTWNSWYNVGETVVLPIWATNRQIIKAIRDLGFLRSDSNGKIIVDDDGYNYILCDRKTLEPLYAIVYGDIDNT
jgi:hypothetical protein